MTTALDSADDLSVTPTAGIITCPVITNAVPASTPARIGTDSMEFHSSQPMSNDGRAVWVSVASRPIPGKCLTVAANPAL